MLIFNFILGTLTLFLPLFIYQAFLWSLGTAESKQSVELEAEAELVSAQG